MRREAEQNALAHTTTGFAVMSVCPSFTFGPDDPVGAPANKLLRAVVDRKLPCTLRVGFGCLDVRDFANGMWLAAQRGQPGRRYLLSGENIVTNDLFARAAAIAGVRPPRIEAPLPLVKAAVAIIEGISALRGRPAPINRRVLQIARRYAWYDTTRARTELGWSSRPLQTTLEDTIAWLRQAP